MRAWTTRVLLAFALSAGAAVPAWAQSGQIAGLVRADDGEPVAGAYVTARHERSAPAVRTTTADRDGRFHLPGLASGTWTLSVAAPGFTSVEETVRLRFGRSSRNLEIKLIRHAPNLSYGNGSGIDQLQELLKRADELYGAGRYLEAVDEYREAIRRAPGLTLVNLQIGRAYRQLGRPDDAMAAYRAVLREDPTNERARLGVGLAYRDKGDLELADLTLTAAAEAFGASREIFCTLAEVKLAQGLVEEAAAWFTRAAEADPLWGRPVFQLGFLALDRGDADMAARYLEQAIAMDPSAGDAPRARSALDQLRR